MLGKAKTPNSKDIHGLAYRWEMWKTTWREQREGEEEEEEEQEEGEEEREK